MTAHYQLELWLELNKMAFWDNCCGIPGWRLRSISHEDCFMRVDMTDEERDIFIRWKKRSDTYKLVRMKAEAIVYAARGVGLDIIAEMVERAEGTVREWLSEWRRYRMGSVVTGHAVGGNAAKLKRAQKEELEEILSRPPSEAGVKAGFWDVPALKDVVQIKFGVEYRSESS